MFASAMTSSACGGDVEERLRLSGLGAVLNVAMVGGKVDQGSICC